MIHMAESVTEGHADKVADYIADSLLDAYLAQDAAARVACEVLCKSSTVVLAGEVTSNSEIDCETVIREAVKQIGYIDRTGSFAADTLQVIPIITQQADEIRRGVDHASGELGAGDQ